MVECNGKTYYTTYELVDFIKDETTELHREWEKHLNNYKNVVLLEQVNRIVYDAKKNKDISFVEYTRGKNGKKKYYAFLVEDLIKYIVNKSASNIKVINKE